MNVNISVLVLISYAVDTDSDKATFGVYHEPANQKPIWHK